MERHLTVNFTPLELPSLQNINKNMISSHKSTILNSQELINKLFTIINSSQNQKKVTVHKSSISIQETSQIIIAKCSCKKSKCLKLYCQCFAKGSFCNGCNCQCCHNIEQHSEKRAKAIDDAINRSVLSFKHKNSQSKGCNCKKTECKKKYCDCFRLGGKCNQYCKCLNCHNY